MWFLRAQYRKAPPILAQDRPADNMRRAAGELGNRWEKRFDAAARELGAYFATAAAHRSDAKLLQWVDRKVDDILHKFKAAL